MNEQLAMIVEQPLSEEELHAAIAIMAEKKVAQEQVFQRIASTIEGKLTSRMGTRKAKENQWLESLRLYLGSLSTYNIVTGEYPFGATTDRTLAHTPEVCIVRNKCEAAISQTIAYQFAAGNKNWGINPPAVSDLDDMDAQAIMQMYPGQQFTIEEILAIRCDLMEKEIEYHLDCTNYAAEARKAMWDRVVFGTGILKGPLNAGKLKKVYSKQATQDGRIMRVPSFTVENVPCIYRVNPWHFFPDDTVTDIKKAEDSIEVHPLSKTELRDLLRHPGYIKDQIEACIEEEPRSYVNSPFNDPAYLTQGINLLKNKYLVMEYHGPISKEDLETLGKQPSFDSPYDDYYGEVWVCNGRVIRIDLENIEGCYNVPYCVSVWEPDPATCFGFGIPMLVRDQQRVINETWKMMLDNAGISAGPLAIIDTTLIKPAEGGLEITPWKVYYSNEYGADVSKAIQFFMPPNAYEGLLALFNQAKANADEESSVPLMLSGLQQPTGAADSATQMAILNQNATSPTFFKAEEWDDDVTQRVIEMMYEWEMQYNPKDEIKGSYEIDVRTSTAFLRNSMEQQKLERLSMEIAQGSPAGEWVNQDALIIARLANMRLPYKGIVKSPQQVAQERANRQPPPPDPNMLKAQAEMQKVQVERDKLEFEKQTAAAELQMKQAQAQMEYEATMRTDAIRAQEAQASVIKAKYDFETAMAQLASRDEIDRTKILADLQKSESSLQTQRFLGGMEMAARAKDQAQKEKELKLKAQGKTGVSSVR